MDPMFHWLRSSNDAASQRTLLRVLLTIPSFGGGGAERVMTTLARRLDRRRFEVHLAVVNNIGPLGENLPADITRHSLDRKRVSQAAIPLLRLVRQVQPDVLLTASPHLNMLGGPAESPSSLAELTWYFARQACWLGRWQPGGRGRLLLPLLAAAYRRADRVIGQSEFATQELHDVFSVPWERLISIANPVEVSDTTGHSTLAPPNPFPEGTGPHLLGVGRLHPVKGFDRAIEALPSLLQTHPQAQLWLIGEGSERSRLQSLAQSLGVADHLFMPGFQTDVNRWLAHADLFVLSSRSESLPNALLEAVASGCPVISLQHPGGTHEAITALGQADRWVESLVPWNDHWFNRPSPEVRQRLIRKYHWQQIVSDYEQLFEVITGHTKAQQAAA
jgi:glycosyltransferase involved in cell wall biosynthesis